MNKQKRYKHKQLWWIAELNKWYYYIINKTNWAEVKIPKELIENSSDRELIPEEVESDWIDEIIKDCINCVINDDLDADILRQSIKKHIPKITEEELKYVFCDSYRTSHQERLINLLKEKWMYKE